jgi:hypothetical protein
MAIPGISCHSFLAPIRITKEDKMPIRQNFKALKEAPAKAIQISVIALLIAITALFVSMGKRVSNG